MSESGRKGCLLDIKFQFYKIIKEYEAVYVFRAEHSGYLCVCETIKIIE